MAQWKVELDIKGIGEILKSKEVADLMNSTAQKVAAAAGPDAEVERYTTDRQAAAVVVKDRDAAGKQAKTGFLTRAAAAAGLEVKGKR